VQDILSVFSQVDSNDDTTLDESRCGPTVVIAAAIVKGHSALLTLATMVTNTRQRIDTRVGRPLIEGEVTRAATAKANIQNKRATFGDLGVIGESLLIRWGDEDDSTDDSSFNRGTLFFFFRALGISPPTERNIVAHIHDPETFFTNGNSWPFYTHINYANTQYPSHFILWGKLNSKGFVYDPFPLRDASQFMTAPADASEDSDYTTYRNVYETCFADTMGNDCAFASITQPEAREAVALAGETLSQE